ncbi:DNA-methyltransferase [Mycoplasma sp. AA7A]|uniref:DNA-methyltransferase n=1 Tax=unclassified Mycoplasma TaxID=2683645 RepID=UPI003A8923A2
MKKYFNDQEQFTLYLSDCNKMLKKLEPKSVDMIFADPPYFLSGDGISCQSGKQVKVFKAKWDTPLELKEKHQFNRKWIRNCYKVLKDEGTIWISGTMHNIYSIGLALEQEGFSIINNVTWQKPNPTPNLSCRCFTHSTETILWARKIINGKKQKHFFNYELMKKINDNKQMKDVWNIKLPSKAEKMFGKHPTQKPLELLERIILASSRENDLVLDPFNGSGTTGIAAYKLKRRYIGIDMEEQYLEITKKRFIKTKDKNE